MKVHIANNNAWSDGNEYIMGTASEVHTNALFEIYPNDTTITAEFKGNTQQNGTPSPSAHVPVVGVGYLDGTAYKIPVEIGLSTQSINLSTISTNRKIKKLVLTGDEEIAYPGSNIFRFDITDYLRESSNRPYCTHYVGISPVSGIDDLGNKRVAFLVSGSGNNYMYIRDNDYTLTTDYKTWLAAQYANGTPVTVYYVLADPVTVTINEPLQKIGDYADSISNITLTITAGSTSFGVDTAVKPSEITLNFRGWHPKDPKESTGGEWS